MPGRIAGDRMTDSATIQLGLWAMLGRASRVVMPNFTPIDWFECDVWAVNLNEYAWEFEIKVSLSDFRNDAKKHTRKFQGYDGLRGPAIYAESRKHDRLAAGDPKGPARFYYVAPKGLIAAELLPSWAGLMEFDPEVAVYRSIGKLVEAPLLHRVKFDRENKIKAWRACYHRFWAAKERTLLKKLKLSRESGA